MTEQVAAAPDVPLVDLSLQHAQIAEEVAAGFERVLTRGEFILGPDVAAFEAEFAAASGVTHCVAVGNGTDAVELALRSVGVGAGDEVIVPANTFVATAGGVVRAGARPVPVDCSSDHLLIDPACIDAAVTERTRAVVPVHLYGQLAPMAGVLDAARRHGLVVVEDAAQCQGATQDGRHAGAWGDVAATSFYPGKNLGAYGDGGAVLTEDDEVAQSLRELRNHGGTVRYQHPRVGFNSRLDSLQAVVLRAKLTRLEWWNTARRVAASRYDALLDGFPEVVRPATAPGNVHAWHLYVVQVPDRDRVLARLQAAGVGAAVHYPVPLHLHGAYRWLGHGPGSFPVAEAAAGRILSLPIYPGISVTQQERVAEVLVDALEGVRP